MITTEQPIMSGYLLKKKRKKLQGMARRFFTLSSNGALSYSFNPGTPVRDSIFISLAYVSASRKERSFHIDSGSTVMHCKALNEKDFDDWTSAFKRFVGTVADAHSRKGHSQHQHHHQSTRTTSLASNSQGEVELQVDLLTVFNAVARMTSPLQDLESIYSDFRALDIQIHSPPVQSSSTPTASSSSLHSAQTSPLKFLSGAANKRRAKSNSIASETASEYFDSKPANEVLLKSFNLALNRLKAQHEILIGSLTRSMPSTSSSAFTGLDTAGLGGRGVGMEDGHTSTTSLNLNFNNLVRNTYPTSTPPGGRSLSRASSFSVQSGETEDYYVDAIPGEFFMEEEDEDEYFPDGEVVRRDSDATTGTKTSSTTVMPSEKVDEPSSGEEEDDTEAEEGATTYSNFEEEEESSTSSLEGEKSKTVEDSDEVIVKRRTELPAPVSGDEFSMLSMLRKNVGKDLSTISFPVTFNEPLSALQRLAEDFEYAELLTRAATSQDPVERMALVATFAVSGSATNKFRSSRKPFNPLLGETYECVRPELGFKFISEKVSHHPPIMAFYAEGKGWTVHAHVAPSQKFWGRSMEILVSGDYDITFEDNGEVFSIRKPSTFVRNLVAGTKYLEIVGDLLISTSSPSASSSSSSFNPPSNYSAIITYKEGSTWGGSSSRNKIEGRILDSGGKMRGELVGRWDECLDLKEGGGGGERFRRLWQVGDWSAHPEKYYGFSPFSITLNELTPLESSLAPTDSRLRPDQLALERGDIEEAEVIKKRVEEKQRGKRGSGEEGGGRVWFEKVGGEGESGWRYKGSYFEKKEKRSFIDPDIF